MLVSRQYPGDPVEIHAVLMLKYAARPETRGHGIPPVNTHPSAFEILRAADGRLQVVQDGAVVERAHREDGYRGERLAVRAGAQVGGDGHLGDVELQAAHHAAERLDDLWNVFELALACARLDRAVLERLRVAAGDESSLERGPVHGVPIIVGSR